MPPGCGPWFGPAAPGTPGSLLGGPDRVAAGRPACQRAARVLRYATALRVTRRPSRDSDSSYGPCGPAWTGASRPSTTLTGRGGPPDSGWGAGPEPVGVGVSGGEEPAGLAHRGAHCVGKCHACAGSWELVKAMAARGGEAAVLFEADQRQRRSSGSPHAACRGVLRPRVNRRDGRFPAARCRAEVGLMY